MQEMYLRLPRLKHSVCGPFTENKERMQKIKETNRTRPVFKIWFMMRT